MSENIRKMTIAGNDISKYTIVLAKEPRPVEETAAGELHTYIEKTCGVCLPVVKGGAETDFEIIVGKNARKKYADTDVAELEEDGYRIFADGKKLVIVAGEKRGAMYAAYDFIEYVLGWKFYAENLEVMRGKGDIVVPADYERKHVPVFEYREIDFVCVRERHIAAKMRINGNYRHFGEELGGELNWGGEIHSFANYFPIDERTEQPCLSDPKNIQIVIDKIAKRLEENPDLYLFEISQNDNQNYCQCERCRKIDEEEGSHAGTMIRFINALSDAFKDKYPKLHFQTFAYQYTRKPPKITKPRDNVIIKLCPMECDPSHALFDPDSPPNRDFCSDLTGWNEIAKKIYIWDYVANYAYFFAPFPNLEVQRANVKFYADNHVRGLYPEGNYISPSGEFAELRSYLLAKLMWNPYISKEEYYAEMEGFMEAYYGKGYKYIIDFINFTQEASAKNINNMWSHPFEMISREDYIANRERLDKDWDEAEKAAQGVQLENVKRSRLQYTLITLTLDYDERYTNGDDLSKKKYMIDNILFYNALVKQDIAWREDFMFPYDLNYHKPPLKWSLPHTYGATAEQFMEGWKERDLV